MPLTLYLIRHGETEGQSSIRYHGRTDVPLSELGRAHMRAARDAIATANFARVFSSPLVRATEGARIIAGESIDQCIIEEFAEVHFGIFEGLTADEIKERHPEEYARWNADRLAPTYAYPGGESRADFAARVERGIERMLAMLPPTDHPSSRSLLVAHRGVIRTIVMKLTGSQPVVDLGSIQILERDITWRAVKPDVTHHLKV